MTSDVASFKTISESLTLGSATVGVARSVSEKVVSTLQDIKSLIVQAQDESVDKAKYQTDIEQKTGLIETYINSAQFNGLNLLDGSSTTAVNVLSSLDRDSTGTVSASFIAVNRQNLSTTAAGGALLGLASIDVETSTATAQAALASIETMMQSAIDAAAAFGSAQNRIEGQNEFVKTLVDAMNTGIGALTDTDMEAASSRLQALQVQQQLGVQALAIANQAPQALLSLFRR
jgi:flagellin